MLQAALSAPPSQPVAAYRRAWGAAREGAARQGIRGGSHSALDTAAPPERPAMESIQRLPQSSLRELVGPVVALVGDMSFYSVMGASTQVIAVDIDSPLSIAFIAATESKVSSVLLWDGAASTFAGVLTVTDYIRILLHCNESDQGAEDVAAMSIREILQTPWAKTAKASSCGFVWGTPNLSVLDCLKAMRDNGINRLPIFASKAFDDDTADVSGQVMGVKPYAAANQAAQQGGCPVPPKSYSIVSVVTLTQLMGHMGRVLLTMGPLGGDGGSEAPLFDVPLAALGVGKNLTAARDGLLPKLNRADSVADALKVMIARSVNAVCLMDENTGRISDIITRSDVLRMESGGSYDVTLSLGEALSWRPAQTNAVVCSPNDSFGDILAHFVNTWVKEMFVVDPQTEEVVGQVSLKELLYFLIDLGAVNPSASAATAL